MRQGPVAAVIQVRHLVLAHAHGQVAPVQEEADRLALGQRQPGSVPRRAQAR